LPSCHSTSPITSMFSACCPLLSSSRLPPLSPLFSSFFYKVNPRGRLSLPTSNLVLTLRLFPCPSTHDFGDSCCLNRRYLFIAKLPFTVFSCRSRFTAKCRNKEKFCGIVFTIRLASSAKVTSSTMQRIFNSPVTASEYLLRVTRELLM